MDVSAHIYISTVSWNKTFYCNSPVLICCFQYEQFQQYYTTKIPQCIKNGENVPLLHFKVSLKKQKQKQNSKKPQEPFTVSNPLRGKKVMGLDHYQSFFHWVKWAECYWKGLCSSIQQNMETVLLALQLNVLIVLIVFSHVIIKTFISPRLENPSINSCLILYKETAVWTDFLSGILDCWLHYLMTASNFDMYITVVFRPCLRKLFYVFILQFSHFIVVQFISFRCPLFYSDNT